VKLPAYPKYKASGVEWLGDVPEHWEVKPLKTSAICWVSNVDKVPAEDELPVGLCNYTDVYYNDYIVPEMELMETTATADEIRRFGLQAGDVVITKDSEDWSDIAVPALVKKSAPDLVCGYHLAIIRSKANALFGDYLLRAFQSCAINQQFQIAASGVTRYGLPKSSIGGAWIPLPPLAEQRAIAEFLDRETGRMDRLVAKKRELIERLKEKRTALISRTVTRGLPPAAARAAGLPENPPLKPSGLDWLGDIPVHWEAVALKHLVSIPIIDGPHETPVKQDNGIPFVSAESMAKGFIDFGKIWGYISDEDHKRYSKRYKPRRGDVLLVKLGATAGTPAIVQTDVEFNIWVPLAAIRLRSKIEPHFLLHILRSRNLQDAYQLYWTFGTQQTLGLETISELRIPVPLFPEQTAIAAYLDAETAKLDALVAKVETAIERLQEYRTALITAAVTGKIDVRNFVASADANQVCSERR
jgi:type I restriction enzyme S subunit